MTQYMVYLIEYSTWTEKNMYYAIVKWGSLWMLIRSSWLIVLLRTSVSLLIFSFLIVFDYWEMSVKVSKYNYEFAFFSFNCTHFCFTYFDMLVGADAFRILIFLWIDSFFKSFVKSLFISDNYFYPWEHCFILSLCSQSCD